MNSISVGLVGLDNLCSSRRIARKKEKKWFIISDSWRSGWLKHFKKHRHILNGIPYRSTNTYDPIQVYIEHLWWQKKKRRKKKRSMKSWQRLMFCATTDDRWSGVDTTQLSTSNSLNGRKPSDVALIIFFSHILINSVP